MNVYKVSTLLELGMNHYKLCSSMFIPFHMDSTDFLNCDFRVDISFFVMATL